MSSKFYIWPRYVLEIDRPYGCKKIVFSHIAGRIMSCLFFARGKSVPIQDLVDAVYFDRDDGGPASAKIIVIGSICQLRRQIAGQPLTIVNERSVGYRLTTAKFVRRMWPVIEPYPESCRHAGPYKFVSAH